MRIALLSDVHGNLPAFEAVLADVDESGADEIWCLGDLVGYGAQPDGCVQLARERCDLCLAGNHDLVVTGDIDIADFSSTAAAAARWTRETISEEALSFLRGLEPAEPRGEIGLYHASPRDPVWEYVLSHWQADECMDLMEPRVGAVGHSHVALWFHRTGDGTVEGAPARDGLEHDLSHGEWLLNPGGVGQPRDNDPRAAWLLLDTEGWKAHWRRVEYPIDEAARAIEEAGLPQALADRLYNGQ
jgi:diadenosine tetraphosphatase ApaH/serine/threonine PP2A family protein phosphatase